MHLDVARRFLVDGETKIPLTAKELSLIAVMTYGRTSTMDKLIYAMQGTAETRDPENVSKTMIHRMRRKFRAAGLGKIIINVWGQGYTLDRVIEVVRPPGQSIVIPAEHRADLERLLFSHPDQVAADIILEFVVM